MTIGTIGSKNTFSKYKQALLTTLCDQGINVRVNGKYTRTAMMHGAETIYLRMLKWMCGVTSLDRMRCKRIRGTTKVGEISKKEQQSR